MTQLVNCLPRKARGPEFNPYYCKNKNKTPKKKKKKAYTGSISCQSRVLAVEISAICQNNYDIRKAKRQDTL
jgi:hypothetical protein